MDMIIRGWKFRELYCERFIGGNRHSGRELYEVVYRDIHAALWAAYEEHYSVVLTRSLFCRAFAVFGSSLPSILRSLRDPAQNPCKSRDDVLADLVLGNIS